MSGRLNEALLAAQPSAIRAYNALAKQTPGCISLTLGEPEFDTPQPVIDAACSALHSHETHYIENAGARPLREAIARFEREKNGLDYSPDEIIVTAGATEAIFTALLGILNPGDEVIVPTPAFVLYEQIIKLCRGVFVPLDTAKTGFQIEKEALSRAITPKTKAIILNSPNNPTGCVLTEKSLRAVYDCVKDTDIFVLCDDVYRQLIYTESYHSFAEFYDLREQILVVQSFSKPYAMTGWRVGYLMADGAVMERLRLLHQFSVVSTPAPFQKACEIALATDVTPLRQTYRARREFVLARLGEIGLTVTKPEGAFYVFPSIEKFGLSSEAFCARMIREAGLAAVPGACFGAQGHIRLSFCCEDALVREGLSRLETFCRALEAEQ